MKKALLFSLMILIFLVSTVYASEGGLEISDITIYYNSDLQRGIRNGSFYSEFIKPGEDIKFEIELENTFKDIDIYDIEIIIKIHNITEDTDIIEDTQTFDLDYGKTKTKSVRLDIPDDADEIIKPVEINIQGIDENGTLHKIDRVVYIHIEDEDHNIRIYKTQLNQTTIVCNETAKLIVWLINDGEHDESKVVLEIENKELGLHNVYDNIEIDEDEKYAKMIFLNFDNVTKSGKFPIEIKTYYKDTHLDDITTIDLWVNKCKEVLVIDETNSDEEEVIIEQEEDISVTTPTTYIEKTDTTKKQKTPVLLIAFIGLVILTIIILGIWFVKE